MSQQKKEQKKKKKREQIRKENLGKYRSMLAARGRDDGFLDHVFDVTKRNDYKMAREMLLQYVEKYPKIARPYGMLASVYASLGDYPGMFWAAEQLLQIGERTFEDYSIYRIACFKNAMPVVLLECEEQMQRRFPFTSDVDLALVSQDMLASFKSDAALVGDDLSPYSDEQLFDLMRRHEKSLLYLSSQRFDLAVRHCDQLIARFPFFRSAYNNKALAIMLDQGPEEVEPLLQLALEHHPDNLFVIAFKIRQLALLGRYEELPAYCDRLATVPLIFPNKHDFFTGKIEAFAWADDLERIIETYQLARKEMGEEWNLEKPTYAMATHYAAVAHARLGNRDAAIELWKTIPLDTIEIASENLEDIQKPGGKQNGPWFFENEQWLPKQFFYLFRQENFRMIRDEQMDDEEVDSIFAQRIKPLFKKAFSQWPSLERTLIEMLKRGGPTSRDWVRLLLGYCRTPELQAAVLDFVMGKSGSDVCRNDYFAIASQLQWLKPGTIQTWQNGELCELRISGIDIHWEEKRINPPLSSEGLKKVAEAHNRANKGNLERAIQLLREVNTKEPGRPTVLYNIATYHLALGHEDVYDETINQMAQDFPDYFFVKTALAKRLIQQGRYDEAMDIIAPLHELTRLHGSEFMALSGTLVMYHLAKGEEDAARSIHRSAVEIGGDLVPPLERFQNEFGQKPLHPAVQ